MQAADEYASRPAGRGFDGGLWQYPRQVQLTITSHNPMTLIVELRPGRYKSKLLTNTISSLAGCSVFAGFGAGLLPEHRKAQTLHFPCIVCVENNIVPITMRRKKSIDSAYL